MGSWFSRWGARAPWNRGIPMWFDPIEKDQLFAVLDGLAPRRGLEWGSGGGTLEILERCPSLERYVSVEHDRIWHRRVEHAARDPRLLLKLVPPNQPRFAPDPSKPRRFRWGAQAEVDPTILADYVHWPGGLGERFDFVLVDGRARCFCLRAGFEFLDPGGILVLHDAQRRPYQEALGELGAVSFLEPWRQGQLAIVEKPSTAESETA